eukprot:CAMPEP_0176368462 /NCGR_PEP_ID=MMETSP0126-20121128/22612_1 /TAXON_ID=141414 ORGANISM="Strombidinopsis acuminatum, Strain SPMC142" /NCGR_SAMPLE_ID=MMETSP0126 /ASSEMBLY_ACC=CAM_ASM_000229 /LENGTH=64 /DNA_ID=CAMNT_0017726723 /DNA_START=702 /DNA_END=896 /DNA_ORIENTATION=-
MEKSYRPASAMQMRDARPKFNTAVASDLRGSHWSLAERPVSGITRHNANSSSYITSNMLNFKWV